MTYLGKVVGKVGPVYAKIQEALAVPAPSSKWDLSFPGLAGSDQGFCKRC